VCACCLCCTVYVTGGAAWQQAVSYGNLWLYIIAVCMLCGGQCMAVHIVLCVDRELVFVYQTWFSHQEPGSVTGV
jgi:hypothetical protein